jgi:hypothetical protein
MAKKIRVWDGSAWQDVSVALPYNAVHSAQASMPSTAVDGQIWLDTDGTLSDTEYIPKTLTSTTGDIIYASSANTPERLGIGTSGQVLGISSGVPSWTTPAMGALTQIANGTLSGANLTISGLTQDTIVLQVNQPTWSSTNRNVYARLNGDTGNNYTNSIVDQVGGTTDYDYGTSTAGNDSFFGNRTSFGNGTGTMNYFLVLTNCKTNGKTLMRSKVIYLTAAGAKASAINDGVYLANAQVTSVTWLSGSTFTGGTYTVWGA